MLIPNPHSSLDKRYPGHRFSSNIRRLLLVLFLLVSVTHVHATHILGGEMFYSHVDSNRYEVILRIYRDCGPNNTVGTSFDGVSYFGVYHGDDELLQVVEASLHDSPEELIDAAQFPCAVALDAACIEVGEYRAQVALPDSGNVKVVYQRCCRNTQLLNISDPNNQGMTLEVTLYNEDHPFHGNHSPSLYPMGGLASCVGYNGILMGGTTDLDGDSLSYRLADLVQGGGDSNPAPNPPSGSDFASVVWNGDANGQNPLAGFATGSMDPVSGTWPLEFTGVGSFAVGIMVEEWRDGELVGEYLRDLTLRSLICPVVSATGCTDPAACNHGCFAQSDNGLCEYPSNPCETCEDGQVTNLDLDGNGDCSGVEWVGCMNPVACNFDSLAVVDDGSCVTGECGCSNPDACNYNPEAVLSSEYYCLYPLDIFGSPWADCEGCYFGVHPDGSCIELGYYELTLWLDTVNPDIGMISTLNGPVDLTGYSTYRLWIGGFQEDDFFSAYTGDSEHPLIIASTGDFFQSEVATTEYQSGPTNDLMLTLFPELEYDSYLTIDGSDGTVPVSNDCVQSTPGDWLSSFAQGGNIMESSQVGGGIFTFNGEGCGDFGADRRVLLGQFTTNGHFFCSLYFQVFLGGDGFSEYRDTFELGFIDGCTEAGACNFNPEATRDDNSCMYPQDLYGDSDLNCEGLCVYDENDDGMCGDAPFTVSTSLIVEDIGIISGASGVDNLTGLHQVDVHLNVGNDDDVLLEVMGWDSGFVHASGMFDSPLYTGYTPHSLYESVFSYFPVLAYDSWLTIDAENAEAINAFGLGSLLSVESGENFTWTDSTLLDSSFRIQNLHPETFGIAGEDRQILLGRFTSNGEVSGSLKVKVAIHGDLDHQVIQTVTWPIIEIEDEEEEDTITQLCGEGTVWDEFVQQCVPSAEVCGDETVWFPELNLCIGFDACPSDINEDGVVTLSDLLDLLADYIMVCDETQDLTPESISPAKD